MKKTHGLAALFCLVATIPGAIVNAKEYAVSGSPVNGIVATKISPAAEPGTGVNSVSSMKSDPPGKAAAAPVKTWDVFEIALTSRNTYRNPYAEISVTGRQADLVEAVFEGVSGQARGRSLRIKGFWDGGQQWKVRFAPPVAGTWRYRTISRDAGMNNKRGTFVVTAFDEYDKEKNATRRGFLRVKTNGPQAGHVFEYGDGTPFLWIGDTWWNWTKREIKMETFRELVDDRAEKGFNLGQLFVAANGWGRSPSILDQTFSVIDMNLMRKVDTMIRYANRRGITVWVHGWWSRENLHQTAGEERIKRWWRYLVHRLGAYNVIWVIAGEYNLENYGGLGLDFWKDVGKLIKTEDPYGRIVSAHNTPPYWSGGAEAPQWSTAEVLHDEKWLDYNQSQVGHGRPANEMIPDVVSEVYAIKPAKPVVVTEPWYEFMEGNPTGMDIRFGAWTAILSGAAGHTYGGGHVWLAHVPESPTGGDTWPLEKEFTRTTYDYEGARSMGYLARFFSKVKWWEMVPRPDLLLEYPDKYCLANAGKEYIAYLRWGGSVKVDLRSAPDSAEFEYYWFEPGTGKSRAARSVKGGAVRFFPAPESYPGTVDFRDWVLHIRRR